MNSKCLNVSLGGLPALGKPALDNSRVSTVKWLLANLRTIDFRFHSFVKLSFAAILNTTGPVNTHVNCLHLLLNKPLALGQSRFSTSGEQSVGSPKLGGRNSGGGHPKKLRARLPSNVKLCSSTN